MGKIAMFDVNFIGWGLHNYWKFTSHVYPIQRKRRIDR